MPVLDGIIRGYEVDKTKVGQVREVFGDSFGGKAE
jgi:hypothetical protein